MPVLSNTSGGLALPAQTGLRLAVPLSLHTNVRERVCGNQVSCCLSREHLDPSPGTPHFGLRNAELPLTEPVFGSSSLWRRYVLKTQLPMSWVCYVLKLSFLIKKTGASQMRKLRPSDVTCPKSQVGKWCWASIPGIMTPEPIYLTPALQCPYKQQR